MVHQVCKDITSWVDPIREQVEECIEQDCNWWCLCCNKWLCSLVWVVIVAGSWVTETVCEWVIHVVDAFVEVATFFGFKPEDLNKAAGMHVIVGSAEEGGLSRIPPFHQVDLIGGNNAKKHASAFNNSLGPRDDGWYNDSGIRYSYRTDGNNAVRVSIGNGLLQYTLGPRDDGWYNDSGIRYSYRIDHNNAVRVSIGNRPERLVQHTPDAESIGTVVKDAPGPSVGIIFVNKRAGELVRKLKFDMIAASGNRIFVREEHTANFYFASMQHEFLNHGPQELGGKVRGATVPGVYATLDAEHAKNLMDSAENPAADEKYDQHPSLKAFANISGLVQTIAGRIYEGLLIVKVFPELWHRLDTRPPVNSGMPPLFVETFNHITYEGAGGIKTVYKSIKIYGVLDIGVGHTNRILHHEAKYGDEVDTMNMGAYPAIAGPIEDGGGFCDGMCNFYVLCKIKIAPDRLAPFAAHTKLTYAILWIDEQTYFCERWRLVGFEDQDWYNLRAWGIAGVYSSFNADSPLYWCPFETSWWYDDSHITDESRLGVSKHTLVVNGRGRIRALHPDNDHEEVPPADGNRPAFHPVLYSVNFTFATSDRTWRWRGYPCPAAAGTEWTERGGAICLPETVRIREDMTIYLKGNNEASVRGYWYQKYLPADNTVVPDGGHLNFGMPDYSYMHGWSFAEQGVFEAADRYSNLGVHAPVDSRSQYYLLEIDENDLPEDFESVPWRDADSRLFWSYGLWLNYEPSPYNTGSFFRILDRRPEGFIAVWWDKRDDELPGLNRIGGDIKLTPHRQQGRNDDPGIMTKRFDRRRKLSPPVVQFAKVSLEVKEGVLVAFSLRFYTRMHDSWDFPTPNEPNDGKVLDLVAKDQTILNYLKEHTPDYVSYDAAPWSRPNFKPDTTIFRVRITAEDPRGVVLPIFNVTLNSVETIFDETVASGFSRKSRYEYLHEWERPTSGESHPRETALLDYCTKKNAARLGTSVWFEDITGHVATAERTTFV